MSNISLHEALDKPFPWHLALAHGTAIIIIAIVAAASYFL